MVKRMPKSILEALPKAEEKVLIQAKIPKALRDRVRILIERRETTWNDVVTKVLQHLVEEYDRSKAE